VTDALLRLGDVTVRRGRREVVRGVSMEVGRGEVVALLGPNGAGKSTLLEAMGGVLPSTGAIDRGGRVATVLQTPGLARRSVSSNVTLALSWWGVPRGERRARADGALVRMRADHLSRRYAGALSGGERRRVHLARGVALRADVLLLDEPFAGLDPETHAALVGDTASALRTAAGAVVVVLHERADAWALADRVVVVFDGRIVADAPPAELLAAPPTAEVARFLGYDGSLAVEGGVLLTRPPDVRLDPEGDREATVVRVVRSEDGARVDLTTAGGTLVALHPSVDIAEGDRVRVRVVGGARFPA
jgi:ABC-type sulfate/molybdate transport systems ATPase subunit